MVRIIRLIAVLLLPASLIGAASDSSSDKALSAYKEQNWEVARDEFKKIIDDGGRVSAELCHNLGNAEFQIAANGPEPRNFGPAVLWYRRALALNRWQPESRQNLRYIGSRSESGFLSFQASGLAKFAGLGRTRHWQLACTISAWLAIVSLVWLVWQTPRAGRRWPLITLLAVSLAALITSALGLIGKAVDENPVPQRRVVIKRDVSAHTAPAEAAGAVISLPPGSEVIPLRTEGLWTYCSLPSIDPEAPLRGWIRNVFTERLWPWNPAIVE